MKTGICPNVRKLREFEFEESQQTNISASMILQTIGEERLMYNKL